MSSYQHSWQDGQLIDLSLGKVVCVGRNYADHAKELNNPVPSEPLFFIKPATSVVNLEAGFSIPVNQGECHHEVEMAILIGAQLTQANAQQAKDAIAGIGLALDLTLRDVQDGLKKKGHPWERAKAFDGSCPMSKFVPVGEFDDIQQLTISLEVDGQIRQQGSTANMLWPVVQLLVDMSACFSLLPGDVVLTGTPAGVGPLVSGNHLQLALTRDGNSGLIVRSQVL